MILSLGTFVIVRVKQVVGLLTQRFFQKLDINHCHQRVIICEWLSHQIDFKTFEETVCWALKSHQLMAGKSN